MSVEPANEIEAIEFEHDGEAIQHVNASGRGVAISVWGKSLVVEKAEAERIEMAGIEFASLFEREMPDGSWRIMTVPVNDDRDENC